MGSGVARVKGIIDEEQKMRPMSLLLLSGAVVLSGMIVHNAFNNQAAKRIVASARLAVPSQQATLVLKYDPVIETTQRELALLGLYKGQPDGVNGFKTKQAIQQYQTLNGLNANGEASQDLLNHIKFTRKIQMASQSTGSVAKVEIVAMPEPTSSLKTSLPKQNQNLTLKKVQVQLASLGYDIANFEGQMNSKTRGAILKFQMDSGMEMSGRVDAILLKALKLR